MSDKSNFQMHNFIAERFPLTRLLNILRDDSASHLVEIIGKSGSGKSYLVKPLLEALTKSYSRARFYSPHPLEFNQFAQVLKLICDVDSDKLDALLKEH